MQELRRKRADLQREMEGLLKEEAELMALSREGEKEKEEDGDAEEGEEKEEETHRTSTPFSIHIELSDTRNSISSNTLSPSHTHTRPHPADTHAEEEEGRSSYSSYCNFVYPELVRELEGVQKACAGHGNPLNDPSNPTCSNDPFAHILDCSENT